MRCQPLRRALLAGCLALGVAGHAASTAVQAQAADGAKAVAAGRARNEIGAGDVIDLKVSGGTDLTHKYTVGPDGGIQLPRLGTVKAAGLTGQELEARLRTALSDGGVTAPDISVTVVRPPVIVTGEVVTPGPVAYAPDLTVLQAIALAGGTTQAGSGKRVRIVRVVDGEKAELKAKLTDLLKPGDIVRVMSRMF